MAEPAHLSTRDARRRVVLGQRLLSEPAKAAGPAAVRRVVRDLGYVQLDSINVVERAHHLTLLARLEGYEHAHLEALYRRGHAFEHWTHDASLLPIEWHAHWHHRRQQFVEKLERRGWLQRRIGDDWPRVLSEVLKRIERDGPLKSIDFEHKGPPRPGGWWNWKPAKVALEYLWWRGDLAVVARPNFHKVYDLTERHVAEEHRAAEVPHAAFARWAVEQAMERLNVATAGEVAAFFAAVSVVEARRTLETMADAGDVERVQVGDARPTKAYAVADWSTRLRRANRAAGAAGDRLRLLSPFDPIARDRRRLLRWFAFDYRFEAFKPAAKRVHGYYVLPIIRGDRFVGRTDLKHDRREGVLRVNGVWWESPDMRDDERFDEALDRLAAFVGADAVERQDAP